MPAVHSAHCPHHYCVQLHYKHTIKHLVTTYQNSNSDTRVLGLDSLDEDSNAHSLTSLAVDGVGALSFLLKFHKEILCQLCPKGLSSGTSEGRKP